MNFPEMIGYRYDEEVDAAYARFSEERVAESIPLDEDFIIDVDKNGRMVGVEILNVSDYSQNQEDYTAALEHMPESGQHYFS